MSLLKAQPQRIACAVLAQPIGRVGAMPPARSARFEAWVETLEDHPEATPQVLDASTGTCTAPASSTAWTARSCRVAGRRAWCWRATMRRIRCAISEELAKLLPNAEFIREWKEGAALVSARTRMKQFLSEHTPVRA